MTSPHDGPAPIERVPTGITGLDNVLRGGLLRGGVYVVMGVPGTGKTILANQVCFHHVAQGGRAVYVTLLTESHARMLAHLRPLTFYDQQPIGRTLTYVSGYSTLEQGGLRGLLDLLRREVREREATLLVVDGLSSAELVAESELAFKRFLHDLQVAVEAHDCTMLLLMHPTLDRPNPEHAAVDGLFELATEPSGPVAVRSLQVHKFRGSGYLEGRHVFEISDSGINVYPRIETLVRSEDLPLRGDERLSFGIQRLDEMLHGGVLTGSTTMLFGAPGSGKTMLGLHFLVAGGRAGQRGLLFGFYEPERRLIDKADQVGLNLGDLIQRRVVTIDRMAPLEDLLDGLGHRLRAAVRREQVQRVFIDGLDGFLTAPGADPNRFGRFFAALAEDLRSLGVTTLVSTETHNLFGPPVELPSTGMPDLVDNIVFLRYVELRSQLYRLISILKVRDSDYEPSIREFRITRQGIEVAATFESAEAILTGIARPTRDLAIPSALERTGSGGAS